MGQVIVRNLDKNVIDSLKHLAKVRGHSLEQEIRDILARSARPSRERLLSLADELRAMTPRPATSDSTFDIRADRDQ